MTLEGTVRNGVVVVDEPAKLAEGAKVKVIVDDIQPGQSLREFLMEFAGSCQGLPPDMAEQHDHYIHGTPKR